MTDTEFKLFVEVIKKNTDKPCYKSFELLKALVAFCDIVIEDGINDYDGNITNLRQYLNNRAIICENNIELLKSLQQN